MHNKKILLVAVMLMILLGAGCSLSSPLTMAATYTPFQPLPVPTKTKPSSYWLDASLPVKLLNEFKSPAGLMLTEKADSADLRFQMVDTKKGIPWVYALVAPFPTVEDEISLDALKSAWDGSFITGFQDQPLLMSRETLAAFKLLWGQPADGAVKVIPSDQILDTAWQNRPALALIPFEELTPRWKVLRVDGQSPLDGKFQPDSFPLTVYYNWVGDENSLAVINDPAIWEKPLSNWDRSKMTVLLMTGTTALVRGTAAKMDQNGSTYPGEKIRDWLQSADLLHISNEVSFYPKCPLGDPYSASLMFCSRPEYIDLFTYIGVDILESTGNHLQDYGIQPFVDTLAKYKENGWRYYAAGQNLDEARQPLLVEDHGNKLAFIGCNPSGPESVWATDGKPGVAT
ncbi:MAG: CapA family protein, partial [Anaerolineaceae bacterium]|nr:CapA family protein [Anaerolineaceae bacterium]